MAVELWCVAVILKFTRARPMVTVRNVKDMERMEGRYLTLCLSFVWSVVLFVIILI